MELEELKQVATGEWHGGHSDEVPRRFPAPRTGRSPKAEQTEDRPAPASPGQARGPAYLDSPAITPPPPGAIWVAEYADPGCAPHFGSAPARLVLASADPWAPGVIVARSLGVPVVVGAGAALASARPGQMLAADGDMGQVEFLSMV